MKSEKTLLEQGRPVVKSTVVVPDLFYVRALTKVAPVYVANEPITIGGQLKSGIADLDNLRIFIGPQVPPSRRLLTMLHELWHLWRVYCPRATTIEEECNQFAIVAESILEDVDRQGGLNAMHRMLARSQEVGHG